MVEITKLPPGKAIGADDLRNWASRRLVNRSGLEKKKYAQTVILVCSKCKFENRINAPLKPAARFFRCRNCGKHQRRRNVRNAP